MKDIHLGTVEAKFAEMIWEREPISSTVLCKLANEELNWHKSTTYTVLRNLCEKGVFKNENAVVTSVLSRDDYYSLRSEAIVAEEFQGSLPAFVAAFAKRKQLTAEELELLRRIVDEYGSEE